jgi:predicted TIM-barrel fold metal-dependent hydrolase
MASRTPLITLEEHFISQAVVDYYKEHGVATTLPDTMSHIMTALREVGPRRLSSMDTGRVSLQVISHRPNPIPIPPEVCKAANDELFEAIKASPAPSRFAAFAMLPMLHPKEAAKELDRCVSDLNFVGSLVDNTTDGRFYDDPFFWPIFAAHEQLDVPIYLHAALAPLTESTPSPEFHGNYSPVVSNFLANHGFHWHSEVALHFLRLFASKLFDKHRNLKVLLGHMGETLPFLIDRIHKLVRTIWPAESKP